MALSAKQIGEVSTAILKGSAIEFEYYYNTNPRGLVTTKRVALPLKLFKNNGKFYLFAYFLSGGSLSGKGAGYRLYLQKNMFETKIVGVGINTETKQNFSKISKTFIQKIKTYANNNLTKLLVSKKLD